MKKQLTLFICTILFWGWATAQTPNLVVKSQFNPSMNGTYTHEGKYNNRDYWRGPTPNKNLYLAYSKMGMWEIGQWYGDTNQMWFGMYNSNTTDKYPTNGWPMGVEVQIEGPALSYSTLELTETSKNEGSFNGKIIISHNKFKGQTFSGQDGDDFIVKNYAKTNNLGTGLTASVLRLSDSALELTLKGKATIHNLDTNFTIEFNNDAFANGGKADSTEDATKKIKLNFVNVITVAKIGGDYSTIDSGFDAMATDDILMVGEGVFTEYDITPPAGLSRFTLIGKGADKTIIQADTAPGIAKGRVFTISSILNANFEGVTIQNGLTASTNAYGGGIMIQSGTLTLKNCRILNNRAFSSNSGQTIAGGIYCINLNIYNTEIAGNSADNSNKTGQIMGGGFYAAGRCHIENSTISGNFSRDLAGGGLLGNNGFNNPHQIINSTISNNEAANTNGGGINTYYTTVVTNSIIYGNKSVKGKDVYQTNGHVYPVGVTKSFIGDILGMQDKSNVKGTAYTNDPKLDTLKFNCGVTRTHALLDGSPARDSGITSDSTPVLDQRGFGQFLNKDIGAHEEVYQTQFEIGQDSICMESTDLITLNGQPNNGVFEGTGVSGNTFDVSKVKSEGYVVITYKYTAPGCDNFSSTDSIYVYTCKVNGVYNPNLTVRVYPNPANDVLWIENSKNTSMNVIVSDLSGKQMMNALQVSGKSSLNISELPAGVYFLTIESNGKKAHQKFIKM
jgi:hypothetical protein